MSGAELPELVVSARRAEPSSVAGGLLHGALLRPPRVLWDGRRYRGATVADLDTSSAQVLPGVVRVVQLAEFVGVVAVSAMLARQALDGLDVKWQFPGSSMRGTESPSQISSTTAASTSEGLSYVWSVAEHPATDGQGATVWCTDSHATAWLPCASAYHRYVQEELSHLLAIPVDRITLIDTVQRGEGEIHILDVLDAAADAALLSRVVGRPVHVPVQRASTPGEMVLSHASSVVPAAAATSAAHTPASAAAGGTGDSESDEGPGSLAGDGSVVPKWASSHPWGARPSLARLLSQPAQAASVAMPRLQDAGEIVRTTVDVGAPLIHASPGEFEAMQVFAHESLLDEEAARLGMDPMAYRLSLLPNGPGQALTRRMLEQVNGSALAANMAAPGGEETGFAALGPARQASAPQASAQQNSARQTSAPQALAEHEIAGRSPLRGRGYATAHVRDQQLDGTAVETWSAWLVEVEVAPETGNVDVTRLMVGRDSQSLQPAQGATIREQDPRLLDAARRLLAAPPRFDDWGASSSGNAAVPGDEPVSHDMAPLNAHQGLTPAQPIDHGQLALDGVMTLPAAAAIGNAIFDATGVRLRQVPFNVEQLRDALAGPVPSSSPTRSWLRRSGLWLAAGAGALAGVVTMAWPLKPALAPTAGPDVSLYSAAAIERGRLVAAAGDCVVCHTVPGGQANAGGLGLDTPFGTIYTTNITPDNETGIGQWSYRAFERAMREGVHRDGRQLYPAFPYTAFAKMTDADMQALYAYLMVQPPVRNEPPKTELPFPYNWRPMMAGWNLLFHDTGVYEPDPAQSLAWNRGAYLVQGAGHCAACHSPRNTLGAEKTGVGNYLAGGEAEGWEAPPLNRLASGKVPWTPDALFQYLRTGYSASHGVAAGPMAPVIRGLSELPESDVRAIATYLLNLPGTAAPESELPAAGIPAPTAPAPVIAQTPVVQPSVQRLFEGHARGERIYQNACAVCHEAAAGPTLFGVKPLLAVNTNLHAATPDNLVQVILHGIQTPANDDLGYMPGFKDSLNDEQVQDLLNYLRVRFAPQEPEWADSLAVIGQIRNQSR
ncbi:c-type cytochrome [Bordetella genomosp. 4]|uniref:c-type cytochrome n=1 Tax=Bordetella genomosp. 4 TaxID=463044 RepID=UPI0020CBAF99|nr:c-type cytochrome [Bordetella genomosp. 4]